MFFGGIGKVRNVLIGMYSSKWKALVKFVPRCLAEGAEEFWLKPVQLSDVKRLKDHVRNCNIDADPSFSKRKAEIEDQPDAVSPKRRASHEELPSATTQRKTHPNTTLTITWIVKSEFVKYIVEMSPRKLEWELMVKVTISQYNPSIS